MVLQLSSESIQRLAWRTDYLQQSMIQFRNVRTPSFLNGSSDCQSSAGSLDSLPLELLHQVFNYLDFRTLFNVVCTSTRGRLLVESLPAYKDVLTHSCPALTALARTELITYHPASRVHAALKSEKCMNCTDYGPFLYLPTCERCCLNCLRHERSLRMMTPSIATKCFAITSRDLHQVSAMISIPGTYILRNKVTHRKRIRLVSARQARELGRSVHGSQESLERCVKSKDDAKLLAYNRRMAAWRSNSESCSQPRKPPLAQWHLDNPNDPYCGMASTPMPSIN